MTLMREKTARGREHAAAVRVDRLPLRAERVRKVIHVATVALPLLAWVLPRPAALGLLGFGAALALAAEWARARLPSVRYHFLRRTRHLLRPHERRGIAGATYMAVGYFLALLLLPLPVAVAAMLYNGLGDSAAALVGKRWGRLRAPWGKSVEGMAAGVAVNVLAGLIVPGIGTLAALLGAVAAALIEFLPSRIDDNLRVTLGGGIALWLALALETGVW